MMLFRLALALVIILLIALQALFTQSSHVVAGDRHIFAYNWVGYTFFGILAVVLIGFAELARRAMKDWITAVLCWLGIPLFAFALLPQYLLYRVEVSDNVLVYRREPPHTRFNAEIPWDQVASVTKIKRENAGIFSGSYFTSGYEVLLKDGSLKQLHAGDIVTAAEPEIDRVIAERKIPTTERSIPLEKR